MVECFWSDMIIVSWIGSFGCKMGLGGDDPLAIHRIRLISASSKNVFLAECDSSPSFLDRHDVESGHGHMIEAGVMWRR